MLKAAQKSINTTIMIIMMLINKITIIIIIIIGLSGMQKVLANVEGFPERQWVGLEPSVRPNCKPMRMIIIVIIIMLALLVMMMMIMAMFMITNSKPKDMMMITIILRYGTISHLPWSFEYYSISD